jgi:glycosyltransferase involved in cell wall biosynthesis
LAQSHLVVAPSLWDCWSHAVREALRANRPVVVTSVGGLSELASDADAGWGLPDTSVEALARRLRDLSEGREEVGRLIDSGAPLRALQRSVDEDRVLAEYRGLAEIAGGEGHGAAPAAASRAASI